MYQVTLQVYKLYHNNILNINHNEAFTLMCFGENTFVVKEVSNIVAIDALVAQLIFKLSMWE